MNATRFSRNCLKVSASGIISFLSDGTELQSSKPETVPVSVVICSCRPSSSTACIRPAKCNPAPNATACCSLPSRTRSSFRGRRKSGDRRPPSRLGSSGHARRSLGEGGGRKVRAPQGRVVPNGDRGRPQGKCHRKQTVRRSLGEGG